MKQCPNCQNPLKETAKFCTHCGAKIGSETVSTLDESLLKCSCGATLKPGAKFCTTCGKKVEIHEEKIIEDNTNRCSCGAELKPTAKFCTVCGKKVLPETPVDESPVVARCACGAELTPDVRFCNTCGRPVQPVSAPVIPPVAAPSNMASHAVSAKPKKKRKGLKIAALIIGIAAIGAAGYWAYNEFFGGIRKKLLVEQTILPSDKDQTVAYEDEISVLVPWGLIDKEQKLSIYSVKGLPDEDGIKHLSGYDVKMSDMSSFDGYLEITMKYDPDDLPDGINPATDLGCKYYNEKTDSWEFMPTVVNTKNNTMTVYTNHLSTFVPYAVAEKVQPGPMMTVKTVKFPGGKYMDDSEVDRTIQKYSTIDPASKAAYMEGWDKVNEWFGITSAGSTFLETALEVGALEGVNQAATEVGLGFALVQCAIDLSEGNTKKATLELTKNLYNYWALKLINTSAINLAFVGVFVIDYSLNKFIKETITDRTNIYQKAYDLYYREKNQKQKADNVYWYKTLKKAVKSASNPGDASNIIDKVIRDYVWEFWNNDLVVAEYQERVMKNTASTGGGYLSEELKTNISNEQYAQIVNTLNQTGTLDRIAKDLRLEMQGKLYDKLCAIAAQLNTVNTIKVIVKVDPGCEEYADVDVSKIPIHFKVPNSAHKDLWKGETDKDGVLNFTCTTLGFLDAGSPKEVVATVEGPARKDEEFSAEFKLVGKGKTTVVEITIGSPKLEGTWKLDATVTEMTLDASLQYMDEFADFYGSGDEYRKERANMVAGLKGQKAQLPDLKLDGIEYLMDVKREGQYYVISSKNYSDKTALGRVQYRIRFTSNKTFEGKYEAYNNVGGKENMTKMDLKGTRKD